MFVHTRTRFKQYKNKFLCLVTFLISYLEAGLAFCLPPAAQQTFHSPNIYFLLKTQVCFAFVVQLLTMAELFFSC